MTWLTWRLAIAHTHIPALQRAALHGALACVLLLFASCPELLESLPHQHLGHPHAGHDATPLEAVEHLLGLHDEAPAHPVSGVSLVGATGDAASVVTLAAIPALWRALSPPAEWLSQPPALHQRAPTSCAWPPASPPPQSPR